MLSPAEYSICRRGHDNLKQAFKRATNQTADPTPDDWTEELAVDCLGLAVAQTPAEALLIVRTLYELLEEYESAHPPINPPNNP